MTVPNLKDADDTASAAQAVPATTDGDDRPSTREELGRYADQGGFTMTATTNPWLEAADSIAGAEDARAASSVLAELRSRDIRAIGGSVTGIAAKAGLDVPDTLIGLTTLLDLLQRVHAAAAVLTADAYDADLDALTAATASGRWRKEQGVKLGWGRRRALRSTARGLAAGRTGRADLHAALLAAGSVRADWAALAATGTETRPSVPVDGTLLAETAAAIDSLADAVRTLGRLLPERSLDTQPLGELADLVDRLAADEGTLYRLSALRDLRTALDEQGLADLLTELTERQADRDAALAAYDRHHDEHSARTALAAGPRTPADEAPATEAAPEVEDEAEPVAEIAAEPVTEPEADVEAESAAEVVVEAAAEPETEPEVDTEPTAEAEPVAEVVVEAEPVTEPEAEPVTEPEAEPTAEVVVEAAAEPETEPEAEVEPTVEAEPVAEVVVETVAEVDSEPEADVAADAEVEVAPVVVEAEPVTEPEAESTVVAEPVAEVAVEADVAADAEVEVAPVDGESETELVAEAAAEAEPAAEVVADVDAEPVVEVEVEVEPAAEVAVEAEAEPEAEVDAQAEADVEAAAADVESEMEPEAAVEAEAEPVAEPEAAVEPTVEAEPEAEVAPVAEPEAVAAEVVAGAAVVKPEITPGRPVTAYEPAELVALVRWLDADGTVRSDDELLRAAMKELGFARLGPRIKEALGAAVAEVRTA